MPSQIDLTLGASEVGVLISSMLYGAVLVQMYTYSARCKGDPLWLIVLVTAICILETIFTVLSIWWVYSMTITNFGNPAQIAAAPWTLDACVTFAGVVGAVVQSFFAYRVYKVSNSFLWPSFAWAGATVRTALSITIACFAYRSKTIISFSDEYGWQVTTTLSVATAVDILNVAALSWFLSRRRSAVNQHTSHVVTRLIIYSIESGLLTSITAICLLVTRLVMLDNYVWICIFQIYARLYSNSLMVSLNARAGFQDRYRKKINMTSTVSGSSDPRQLERGINVQMVTFTETDDTLTGSKEVHETEDANSSHTTVDVSRKSPF